MTMNTFGSVDAVLDFAIEREQEAVDFYHTLALQTEDPSMKKTLTAFAGVEQGHKEKLMAAKDDKIILAEGEGVVDMKVGDYLVAAEPGPDMSFQDALIVAMKREKAAMDLYTDMATKVSGTSLQALFKKLAREEGTHKLTFESLYEEHFLSDN